MTGSHSKRRAAPVGAANSRGDLTVEVATAVAAGEKPQTRPGPGMVDRAVQAMHAPKFCACCTEERRGLTPVETRSAGATKAPRVTWLCCDCVDAGSLAELAQHDLTDGRQNAAVGGRHDGCRQVPRAGTKSR